MVTQTATLASLAWQNYAANSKDLIAPVVVDLNTYASVSVTPIGAAIGVASQIQAADGVVVDNMQGTADLTVQIGPVIEFVPRFQKTVIPLYSNSPPVIFSGVGIMPRVYFYVGTFRGVGNNLNAFASNQAANVASITGGTVDAYLHTLRWQINYQLNAGFNLDNIIDSGFYDVLNPVNSGTSLAAGTWQIDQTVYSASPLFVTQRARNLISNDTQLFERRCVVGVWTPWRNVGLLVTGQCEFQYVSATQCKLVPKLGGLLTINGNQEAIPAGGVTISNTIGAAALAPGTAYFCNAYMLAGVMTLEWSTTAFAYDARGLPIKAGDPTRTCVGGVVTNASAQFQDDDLRRTVATFFNRRWRRFKINQNGLSTSSTTPIQGNPAVFFSWGEDATRVRAWAVTNIGAQGFNANLFVGLGTGAGAIDQSTIAANTQAVGNTYNQTIGVDHEYTVPLGTGVALPYVSVSGNSAGFTILQTTGASLQ